MSLDAETIPEAEEILGTMQNYLDSSVISIIEDLSLSEVGPCAWRVVAWATLGPCCPTAVFWCPLSQLLLFLQGKACLDAQNELSLLTAITEILDSTDDETLSPFDTIMDAELLTSLRERENPSVSGGASPSTQSALLSLQVWGLVGWGIHRRLRSTMPICTANLG